MHEKKYIKINMEKWPSSCQKNNNKYTEQIIQTYIIIKEHYFLYFTMMIQNKTLYFDFKYKTFLNLLVNVLNLNFEALLRFVMRYLASGIWKWIMPSEGLRHLVFIISHNTKLEGGRKTKKDSLILFTNKDGISKIGKE